jgi:hypothetical protein
MYRRAFGQANQLVPQFAAAPLKAKIWRRCSGLSQVQVSAKIGKSSLPGACCIFRPIVNTHSGST